MESNHKFKENQMKHCSCCSFDGITNFECHRRNISGISKSEAIRSILCKIIIVMENIYFTEERGTLKNTKISDRV